MSEKEEKEQRGCKHEASLSVQICTTYVCTYMVGQHMAGQHMVGQHMAGQHMVGQHMAGQHMAGQHTFRDMQDRGGSKPLLASIVLYSTCEDIRTYVGTPQQTQPNAYHVELHTVLCRGSGLVRPTK